MLCLWCVVDSALHIPTLVDTTANIRWLIITLSPEAICCLQTCYVYGVLVTLLCTYILSRLTFCSFRPICLIYKFVVVYKPVVYVIC